MTWYEDNRERALANQRAYREARKANPERQAAQRRYKTEWQRRADDRYKAEHGVAPGTAFYRTKRDARVAEQLAAGKKPCPGPLCNGAIKGLDQFEPAPKKAVGVSSHCRACKNAARKARGYRHTPELHATIRAQAIAIYGGHCERCGTTSGANGSGRRMTLEFDHIDGDGGEHRKVESHQSMLKRIVAAGCPIEDRRLRLLCPPCHQFLTGGMTRYKLMMLMANANDWPVLL
jgi:hypothetical protein